MSVFKTCNPFDTSLSFTKLMRGYYYLDKSLFSLDEHGVIINFATLTNKNI